MMYLIVNLVRTDLIVSVIHIFVKNEKTSIKKLIFAYAAFFLMNMVLSLAVCTEWISLLLNLIGIMLLVMLYTRDMRTVFPITLFVYVINVICYVLCDAICEGIITMFLGDRRPMNMYAQLFPIIILCLFLICSLVVEKVVRSKSRVEENALFPLLMLPVCSIVIIVYMFYSSSMPDWDVVVISIGLLVMNFFIFYIYNLLVELLMRRYENDILQQKIMQYVNQIEIIQQSEDRVRALRHDMKHHINEIRLLAKEGRPEAILEYVGQMDQFLKNPGELVSSGNMEIDSMMNYMLQKAEEAGMKIDVRVQLPEKMTHSFDIVVILGNLIENAVEAAEKTEERCIRINVMYQQGILKVQVENSFRKEELKKTAPGRNPATTKQDASQHGLGLVSVRKIVEKHHGDMEITVKEERFRVNLMMYIPQS